MIPRREPRVPSRVPGSQGAEERVWPVLAQAGAADHGVRAGWPRGGLGAAGVGGPWERAVPRRLAGAGAAGVETPGLIAGSQLSQGARGRKFLGFQACRIIAERNRRGRAGKGRGLLPSILLPCSFKAAPGRGAGLKGRPQASEPGEEGPGGRGSWRRTWRRTGGPSVGSGTGGPAGAGIARE